MDIGADGVNIISWAFYDRETAYLCTIALYMYGRTASWNSARVAGVERGKGLGEGRGKARRIFSIRAFLPPLHHPLPLPSPPLFAPATQASLEQKWGILVFSCN